jgi:hypothetical protein
VSVVSKTLNTEGIDKMGYKQSQNPGLSKTLAGPTPSV